MIKTTNNSKGDFTLKKAICRTLCLVFVVVLFIPLLSSCGKDKSMYELGDYKITEKEYCYLMGMFKKKVLASYGSSLTDDSLSQEISAGVTLGDYLEGRYRDGFEQSVLSLLYSQSLFDTLGLSLSADEINTMNATATAVIAYYGNYSESEFDKIAKSYGFDNDAMRSVYEMQFKENKLRHHLLGENYEKVTDADREEYYRESYLRYQTLIVNTLYKLHTDSTGEVSFQLLDEYEKAEREQLVLELKELLVNNNLDYDYIILKDDKNLSFEKLWEKYSDDKFYPRGLYETSKPTPEQLANSNVLSAAYNSKIGETKVVTAKRYFEGEGSLDNGDTTIKPGDYFEYGSVFVKRLELDASAYDRPENKLFFSDDTFESAVYNYVFFEHLSAHQDSLPYEVKISTKITEYTFASVKANELDYYLFVSEDE